jgi:hypothetical protein
MDEHRVYLVYHYGNTFLIIKMLGRYGNLFLSKDHKAVMDAIEGELLA